METSPKNHLSERELLRVELPEARYRSDLALFDHGQSLSAELLKLSLAAIAVVGALLPLLPKPWPRDEIFRLLLSISVIAFAISTGLALLQRFYASSGIFHHIKAMKLASRNESSLDEATEIELRTRLGKFNVAHSLLKATAISLSVGAGLLASAFIRLMFIL